MFFIVGLCITSISFFLWGMMLGRSMRRVSFPYVTSFLDGDDAVKDSFRTKLMSIQKSRNIMYTVSFLYYNGHGVVDGCMYVITQAHVYKLTLRYESNKYNVTQDMIHQFQTVLQKDYVNYQSILAHLSRRPYITYPSNVTDETWKWFLYSKGCIDAENATKSLESFLKCF
jgi:hypothetical protein